MKKHLVLLLTVMLAPFASLGQVAPYAPIVSVDPFGWDNTVKVLAKFDAWTSTGNFPLFTAENTAATTPTLDCRSTDWSGSGNWTCDKGATSYTGTLGGNPTRVASPYYSSGFSASADNAIRLDGTGDGFDFGDVLDAASDVTQCVVFRFKSWPASFAMLVAKDGGTANTNRAYEAYVQYAAGVAYLKTVVFWNGGSSDNLILTGLSLNTWYAYCWSYDYVPGGTATDNIFDASLNGSNFTAVTTLNGPLIDSPSKYIIGYQDTVNKYYITGDIYRVLQWDGWAASSTQLQALSNSLMGLYPNGKPITFSRSTISMCRPAFGAQEFHYLGANMPCWTSNGLRTWKGGTNGVPTGYSEAIGSWSAAGSCAVTADQYAAPDGATTMDLLDTAGGDYQSSRYTNVTLGATKYITLSGWVRAATGTTTASLYASHATETITACTGEVISGSATVGTCTTQGCSSGKNCACQFTNIGTSPARVAMHVTLGATQTAFVAAMAPGTMCVSSGWTEAQAAYWGIQMETGKIASPYYPSNSAWAVEYASASSPLTAVQPSTFAIKFTTPEWVQGTTADYYIPLTLGSYTGANTASIRLRGDGATLIGVFDSTATAQYNSGTSTASYTPYSKYWFALGYTGDNRPKYLQNGQYQSSPSGSGTGIMSANQSTLSIGSSVGSYPISGYVSKVKVCKGTRATECAK